MLKSNFVNREKLVPTRIPTRTFEFKFGMQGLTHLLKVQIANNDFGLAVVVVTIVVAVALTFLLRLFKTSY